MHKELVAVIVIRANVKDRILVELLEQLQRYTNQQTSREVEMLMTIPSSVSERLLRSACST